MFAQPITREEQLRRSEIPSGPEHYHPENMFVLSRLSVLEGVVRNNLFIF